MAKRTLCEDCGYVHGSWEPHVVVLVTHTVTRTVTRPEAAAPAEPLSRQRRWDARNPERVREAGRLRQQRWRQAHPSSPST